MERLREREISLKLRKVLGNYLDDRKVIIERGENMEVNRGVPQGSILGPTLWNVLYDDLLGLTWREGVDLVAYADDLAVVVAHKKEKELSRIATGALTRVNGWMVENDLELAPEKTEAMMIAGMRRPKETVVYLEGMQLELKKEVKYLGIVVDKSLTFSKHVEKISLKAETAVASLARILPNVGGPKEGKRRVLAGMTNSIVMYGAQVWADAIKIGRNKLKLLSVQRKMALRVCCGYRTISTGAALVVAGLIPIDLLIQESQLIEGMEGDKKERRRRARELTMDKWQREWERTERGAWTRRLIQDVRRWKERAHGGVTYHLTQVLTGHGAFAQYLNRFKIRQGEGCAECGRVDTPEHLMTTCDAWARDIERMSRKTGENVGVENVIEVALRGKREWDATLGRMACLMKGKEERMRVMDG